MKIVSGKHMCRVLGSRGWRLIRINGSHHIFIHPAQRGRIAVPVHANKDLKQKTQRSIMRVAGLQESDL